VLLTHANPDTDAVGSLLAPRACVAGSTRAHAVASGDHAIPDNLVFLSGATDLTIPNDDAIAASDLLIFIDCSDPSRLGHSTTGSNRNLSAIETRSTSIIVTNDRFGN
jgi:phosphoesterase RecJ-like protein